MDVYCPNSSLLCFPCAFTCFSYSYIQTGGEGRLYERYAKSIEPILSEDIR